MFFTKHKSLLIALFSIVFSSLCAQEDIATKNLNIGIGLSTHSILDDLYTPFAYNTATPTFLISWSRKTTENLIEAGLDFGFSKAEYNDFELFTSNIIDVDVYALYAKPIGKREGDISWHLGGLLDYRILFLLNMPDEFEVGNASYTAALQLGAYVQMDYELNEKSTIMASFNTPLVGTAVRNPYTGFDQATTIKTDYGNNLVPLIFHDPKLTHGAKFFRPTVKFAYKRIVSEELSLTLGLMAQYFNYDAINPVKSFKTSVSFAANF